MRAQQQGVSAGGSIGSHSSCAKCIIHRVNQSATYLSEGDGHHELAAHFTVSDYNAVVRVNGEI
jgi:hypothetical protein